MKFILVLKLYRGLKYSMDFLAMF